VAKLIQRSLPAALPVALVLFASVAVASSHREAPFIAGMPRADATDFYMFRSYEPGREKFVTLVANYLPLQDAYGGPNYFQLDPNALYEIHIDNNGDAREDITFQFRFANTSSDDTFVVGGKKVPIPLIINGGAINDVAPPGLNVRETYTASIVRGDRRTGVRERIAPPNGAKVFDKPVDNIGNKAIPDYAAYAARHVYDVAIPGCDTPARLFVGQRKDSFAVNLGETFDLVNYKSPAVEFDPNAERSARDDLADKNVTTIALEVAASCLVAPGGADPVIGGWTTASVPQVRAINPVPFHTNNAAKEGGAWTQVSRLGMPLVNELVIGLKDKDRFNHSRPGNDAQFLTYVTNPTLPALVETLFAGAGVKAPSLPRNDLVTVFLTGVPGLNQPAKVAPSEMLRLNTAIAPVPKGSQKRLGVIDGDNAGFPNGRRPGDDVVDIELRVAMGKLCTLNLGCTPASAPSGAIRFTDGAYLDDSAFTSAFPYLVTPIAGSPQSVAGR
jgi:Domain of unknown function (DUF4331)